MTFAGVANHARLTLVCWVVVFYMGIDNDPMMMVSTGTWLYEGQVEAGTFYTQDASPSTSRFQWFVLVTMP